MTLALAYRPRTFDDLVGQRVVQVVLRQMVAKDRIPAAILLDGGHGTGKTTTLRILAAATACDTPPDPCGHCAGCTRVHAGTSTNLLEIDAASTGGVDDIRALRQQLRHATSDSHRFIGLDEAHSMSGAAFNALLKVLEEPPPHTTIVLLTTDPGKIPDTIVSRCMRFTFRPLSPADITERLAHICAAEGINADPDLLALIATRARGALRDAVMLLDQVTRVGITTALQFADLLGDIDPGPALLDVIRRGDPGTAYQAVNVVMEHTSDPGQLVTALAATLRDICIVHSGGVPGGAVDLDARQRLASTVDSRTAVAALRVLWDYATRIRPGEDKRTALDLAVAALSTVFAPAAAKLAPEATSAPPRTLTFAEMARMSSR
jgi:DNA polymerase-3 subunit gamma/tau